MLTKFAKPYEKSHEKNLNCFERYDALFEIKNNFQFLVLGTPEGYPALDPFNFIKVDSKFGIMTQSSDQSLKRLWHITKVWPDSIMRHPVKRFF